MSGEKTGSPCNKFQANIFNKSKCQNCFKSRELHLLTDHDMEQAKPVYGGWLCLAPEGTDFDNPMQRSRKWQRRFFILYEHGSLRFALDELPSTLPQGTVNMNLCTDITDAEPRTGQRNALCIVTSEQEIFIRGDNKEILNGWSEQLAVYLRTNRQNQKKKRKVDCVPAQEPSPAKMPATEPSFPSTAESAADSGCGRWQEEQRDRGPETPLIWSVTDPPGPEQPPAGSTCTHLCSVSRGSLSSDGLAPLDLVTGQSPDRGSDDHLAELESDDIRTSTNDEKQSDSGSPAERLPSVEVDDSGQEGAGPGSRKGRSEARTNKREKLHSSGDITQLAPPPPQRRAKSLDRRTSDTVMTLDLLNFKKGWMVKLDGNEQWKKYWFVLSADSLRYYKDSIAEEASDLEGEIDLTKCYNVSEYQVQRNYGFQIHTSKGVYTLSAMTAGIRKNWIQALMKNVHPAAPDVASRPAPHLTCPPPEALPKPDVTPDAPSPKAGSVTERRREGHYGTFDWAEFWPPGEVTPQPELQRGNALLSLELGDLERRRRREERRRRYETMLGFSLGWEVIAGTSADAGVRVLSPKSQQKVEEEMEACWKQVEKTLFRQERSVLLLKDTEEMERLLDAHRKVEVLKAQLAESERRRLELEDQMKAAGHDHQHIGPSFDADTNAKESHSNDDNAQSVRDAHTDTADFPQQTPAVWLYDADGSLQQPGGWPGSPSPSAVPSESEEQSAGLDADDRTANHRPLPVKTDSQAHAAASDYSSLDVETPAEGAGCCVEQHIPPDQAMVRRLSQEVELLTVQNQALNQRNQEMLNQLTEADREIERLKAELSGRYSEPRHLPEVERTKLEELEKELSVRHQQLLEAQTLIRSLQGSPRSTEELPQPDGRQDRAEGYLLRCFEATEAKLTQLEQQLHQSELSRRELQAQNLQLKEAAAETQVDIRRLNERLAGERLRDGKRSRCGEERIQQVIEGMMVRLNVLGRLLEVIGSLDLGVVKRATGSEPTGVSQVRWEEELWTQLLNEACRSQLKEERADEVLLREVTEQMMVEQQMLLFSHDSLADVHRGPRKGLDIVWNVEAAPESEDQSVVGYFQVITQLKSSWLSSVASSAGSSACDKLRPMADKLLRFAERPWSGVVHSAATEAMYCCHMIRMQSTYQKELEETRRRLKEENGALRARLSVLEEHKTSYADTSCQTDTQPQEADDGDSGAEPPPLSTEGNQESSDEDASITDTERVLLLMGEVQTLKEEFDARMSSVQTQHQMELAKIKATCDRGFSSMEESHLKVVEELQRRHHQEVESLLVERDRLLEEETAATATAIEAIESAHRLELEREAQRRWQSVNADLEDVYRQHSEELASVQRELEVLSQQFSLRCLENGHLVQALDAERKALCQCQQENQDLRTRNQELSSHLAAEITRLCSLAKRDELPLSQGMDVYEMEITLRVKESEVQCLKQEVKSLKEELQSAQRDKRTVAKKCKDIYAELSVVRAKNEQEMDQLRENLRLANRALSHISL